MPVFEGRWVLELGRRTRVFLHVKAGLTGARTVIDRLKAPPGGLEPREKLGGRKREVASADQDASRTEPDGIKPENIIWIFGSGRTGSTWLGRMMGDLEDHALWHEPYVGEIFGSAYYVRAWERQREREGYILSRAYKHVWLRSVRDLVLEGARARYPDAAGYLVIKEPHGSVAAPLLMEALPESRMVFLVRDPRDVAASRLDAHKQGSWTGKLTGKTGETLADRDPDAFVKAVAEMYLQDMGKTKQAYNAFDGCKTLVRYEELRTGAVGELKRMYSELGIPVAEEQLRRVVEKHDWENIPETRKGAGKSRRKASPGSWRVDLTEEQVRVVEGITAPLLNEFYPE